MIHQEISRTWTSREDYTHPCAPIMLLRPLLRTTHGSCRYGTTHGVDVHTERGWRDGIGAWLRLCRRAAGWPDGCMMLLHCCCWSEVRAKRLALKSSRSFDFGRDTLYNITAAVYSARYYSAAVVRRQQVVLAAIVPTDLVCTG